MTHKPKPKNKGAITVSLGALALGAVLLISANGIGGGAHGIVQLFAVFSLTASLFILIRYRMTEFTYSLTERNGSFGSLSYDDLPSPSEIDFVVDKKLGTRTAVTDLRLSLDRLVDIRKLGKDGSTKYDGVIRRYNYCVTFPPDERYMLIFDDPTSGRIAVLAELDDAMASVLTRIKNNG